MAPPNRLGTMLRYFGEAYDYAFAPTMKADNRPRGAFYAGLSDMASRERYAASTTDNVDLDQAMRLAITSAWVYSAIKLISDRTSAREARPKVCKQSGEELIDIKNHEFEQLLQRPNSLMTWDYLMTYTTMWAHLAGNAYIFVSTPAPGKGKPDELWPIPATMVQPLPASLRISALTGGLCIDYQYTVDGKTYKLPGENVIHIRMPNPFDYWRGLSPLSAGIQPIKTDQLQAKYLQSFFGKDNAIPTAIISLPQETNAIDFEIAKEQIRAQFGEGRRSAITRAGDISVQTITQTIQQMEIVNTRRFSREEINHIYGIPDGLITSGASGDSRLATEIAFTRNTVQPFLDRFTAELTANIAPYYGKDIRIVSPSIIPQDRSLKQQEYTTYSQDRTPNENRKELNLPPISASEVLDELNAEREKKGLEPLQFSDGTLDLMLRMPTRLHAFISSNTFLAAQPPAYANVEQPEAVGDLQGMWGPEGYTQDMAQRAIQRGVMEELKAWRTVATKEAREGRDPAQRTFTSDLLPPQMIENIATQLTNADEAAVNEVFHAHLSR